MLVVRTHREILDELWAAFEEQCEVLGVPPRERVKRLERLCLKVEVEDESWYPHERTIRNWLGGKTKNIERPGLAVIWEAINLERRMEPALKDLADIPDPFPLDVTFGARTTALRRRSAGETT